MQEPSQPSLIPDVAPFDVPVAISGAGVTGLALAYALERQGIDSQVYERNSERATHAREALLFPRALDLLAEVGLLEPLREAAVRIDTLRVWCDREPSHELALQALASRTQHPYILACPQGALEDLLREALRRSPPVVHEPAEVLRVAAGDGPGAPVAVDVRPDQGSRIDVVRAALAVGCDGSQSLVRRRHKLGSVALGQERTYVTLDARQADSPELQIWLAGEAPLASCHPLPGGWTRWNLVLEDDEDGLMLREPSLLAARLRALPGAPADVEEVGWFRYFTATDRITEPWCLERIMVLGEAAHLINPWWGMGLSASLLDALEGARLLAPAIVELMSEAQAPTGSGPSRTLEALAASLHSLRESRLACLTNAEAGALRRLLNSPGSGADFAARWTGA